LCTYLAFPLRIAFSGADGSSVPKPKRRRLQPTREIEEGEEEVMPMTKSRRQLSLKAKAKAKSAKEAKLAAKIFDKWTKVDYMRMRSKNPYCR
jgi:hypothetical protein